MTDEDIPRLQRGVELKAKIKKIDGEIEQLKNADQIRVVGKNTEDLWVGIPVHLQSKHPITPIARNFLLDYILHLELKKKEIQDEFNQL